MWLQGGVPHVRGAWPPSELHLGEKALSFTVPGLRMASWKRWRLSSFMNTE